jgi:hypothetical protein
LPTLAGVGLRRRGQVFTDCRLQTETLLDRRANCVE